MAYVITAIAKGEPVEVVAGTDEICAACPHVDAERCSLYGDKVEKMDAYILSALGGAGNLSRNAAEIDELMASVFKKKSDIDPVCHGCRWRDECDFFNSYKKK